jgi:hypothetical protein
MLKKLRKTATYLNQLYRKKGGRYCFLAIVDHLEDWLPSKNKNKISN